VSSSRKHAGREQLENKVTVKPTDIRVKDISFAYEDHRFRTPIKFGGTAVDRVTLVNVFCTIETRAGKIGKGFGSMPLGNVWSFPSRRLTYDDTLEAMKALTQRIATITSCCTEFGHPIDLTWALEQEYQKTAKDLSKKRQMVEPLPELCTLVAASPFDAALHDAFGKVHGLNCYRTYGPDFVSHDLGHYLGKDFAGVRLEQHVSREPQPSMPLYHLVGALDPLEAGDLQHPVGDGLPETLAEWIRADGLTHIKIKLNGDDVGWDVERVMRVDRITEEVQSQLGVKSWCYSLDFNERCPSVESLLTFLHQVKERTPRGFERIAYIEQPTARDLEANRHNVMHEAAKIRPVVIDESLLDLHSLQVAREMGYTGAALKACKGQTQSLLLAAAARQFGMFLCVQDLTCPGASLIHSAGLAAHVPGVAAIESNARQYVPAANKPWEERFPGIFRISDGRMRTAVLTGPGLGAVPTEPVSA
jgi:L-alanine-DL-glutamate epimerase-like enolase superfamily enzyme